MKPQPIFYDDTYCAYGLVYGICVGTKGQDTTNIRKGTEELDDGDIVCEGCYRVHVGGEE